MTNYHSIKRLASARNYKLLLEISCLFFFLDLVGFVSLMSHSRSDTLPSAVVSRVNVGPS